MALDARTIKRDLRTLSAIDRVGLRAELTRRLGVRRHEPVNEIADIADTVIVDFSARAGEVQRRIDEKLDRFIGRIAQRTRCQNREG